MKYYLTSKGSETGNRFSLIESKMKDICLYLDSFFERMDASSYQMSSLDFYGGCDVVIFREQPSSKIWKPHRLLRNGYVPNALIRGGFEMALKLDNLPVITTKEINSCIGLERLSFGESIGFAVKRNYYGFCVKKEWNVIVPDDCIEVSEKEYTSSEGLIEKRREINLKSVI